MESISRLMSETGFANIGVGHVAMLAVGCLLVVVAILKNYEPLLLIPIGFGAIMANLPGSGVMEDGGGILWYFYNYLIKTEIIPCVIFLCLGALTDFGPMIANPKTILLGAAAQLGVFAALLMAVVMGFDLKEAASIGIIGGADGPTTIYLTTKLAPHLLGPVAVSAYSYMSLVPIIQPPIMRLLTTKAERMIVMKQPRPVSKTVKIIFPFAITLTVCLLLPATTPLIGMFMVGNIFRESGVVDRLAKSAQNELVNIVTILLGLGVGATMGAETFLNIQTIGILILGMIAFMFATAGGVLFGKLMNRFSKEPVNPLIGAAGVSAVPMAARVVQRVGAEENPDNFLLMHAMGANVAGVIGTATAAGILLSLIGG
ncbi:MAG TPA: sodium ion-translocating decarboxylase subunit beta [bacterium]|nr:sodium ion-translocating decarboxylase subunit beta [bacterium]